MQVFMDVDKGRKGSLFVPGVNPNGDLSELCNQIRCFIKRENLEPLEVENLTLKMIDAALWCEQGIIDRAKQLVKDGHSDFALTADLPKKEISARSYAKTRVRLKIKISHA